MKQRKVNLQNFAGENILSREEMKNVLGGFAEPGGGTCCFHVTEPDLEPSAICGLSKTAAQNQADQWSSQTGLHSAWCCDNCPEGLK